MVLLATTCGDADAGTIRYHDPERWFSADFPGDHVLSPIPPTQDGGELAVLSGVVAAPPQEAQPAGIGIGLGAQAQTFDFAVYQILAVETASVGSVEDFAALHGSLSPTTDVRHRDHVTLAGRDALLVVGDHSSGTDEFGAASVFTTFPNVSFWVMAVFPPGEWEGRQDAFFELVRSFRIGTPAGLGAVPSNLPPSIG
jgi:hypothetical protein